MQEPNLAEVIELPNNKMGVAGFGILPYKVQHLRTIAMMYYYPSKGIALDQLAYAFPKPHHFTWPCPLFHGWLRGGARGAMAHPNI